MRQRGWGEVANSKSRNNNNKKQMFKRTKQTNSAMKNINKSNL